MRRLLAWVLVPMLVGLAGCGGVRVASAAEVLPPATEAAGPYSVGLTWRVFTRPSSTTGQPRRLFSLIWYPADHAAPLPSDDDGGEEIPIANSGAPYPVVVYSHGNTGKADEATYLTKHLASEGFVVIAPAHEGNTAFDCPKPCVDSNPAFAAAHQDSYANRPDDIGFLLDQVAQLAASDDLFQGALDTGRMAVAGHSLGGATALIALSRDSRLKAGVAFSPAANQPFLADTRAINVPVLIMAGAEERLRRPDERFFANLPRRPEDLLLELQRAGHLAFNDRCPDAAGQDSCPKDRISQDEAHARVNAWTTAFLLRYLAGDTRYAAYLTPQRAKDDPLLTVQTKG